LLALRGRATIVVVSGITEYGTGSGHTKRRCVNEAKMLRIPKTRKRVTKELALTAPSQLSFHFVV
jgi:hypothetical protein